MVRVCARRFAIFATVAACLSVEVAGAGILSRLMGRRANSGCPACRTCVPQAASPTKKAAPRSSCYTLPNGVRVCPVR